jgi:hypothetical protein
VHPDVRPTDEVLPQTAPLGDGTPWAAAEVINQFCWVFVN